MRVTERMIFDGATRNAGRAAERLQSAAEESATGIRVTHPGDDAAASGGIVAHRVQITRLEAIASTAGRAVDELNAADGALDGVGQALTRAKELAMQLSNDTYSASQRASAAEEVQGLLSQTVAQLNTRVGNRYLFGGFRDDQPPFDATGAYLGDAGVRQAELAPGVLQATSVRADVAVGATGTGTDVFATLTALSAALSTNDVAGIRGTLDGLEAGLTQISAARASGGSSALLFEAAETAAKGSRNSEVENLAGLQEADFIESASRLALAERALDAALTSSAKSFSLTLLDKLR